MKVLNFSVLFLPDSVLPVLLVVAGLCMTFGLRRLAGSLVVLVILSAFSPLFEPVAAAAIAALPWWALLLAAAWVLNAVAGRALRDIAVHVAGDLIASLIKYIFASPRVLLALAAAAGVICVVYA